MGNFLWIYCCVHDGTLRAGVDWSGKWSLILITMPVVGALTGFIMGAIHAFLYNVFAGRVGGINLEFQQ